MTSIVNEDQVIRERFAKDVAEHEMTILNDNGVYRHLDFRVPEDSHYWFGITTFPDYLVITGDMGCFVFSRWNHGDMFTFFGGDGRINPSYWHEKLQSDSGSEEFSPNEVESWLRDEIMSWLSTQSEENDTVAKLPEDLWPHIENDILNYANDEDPDINQIREAIEDFEFEGFTFDTSDYRVPMFQSYTYCYLWCLHAIQWGIATYRAQKKAPQIFQGTGVSTKSA